MDDWIPIIGSLCGTLIGGLITYLTMKTQIDRKEKFERNRMILEKLEETSEVLSQYRSAYNTAWVNIVQQVSTGKGIDKGDFKKLPSDRLKTLIRFYSPSLLKFINQLDVAGVDFGESFSKLQISWVNKGRPDKDYLTSFNQANKRIGDICEKLQQGLALQSNNYVGN